jgi:hypothetical protein
MSQTYQGSCLCGGVRYTYTGGFGGFIYCHCSLCRKAQGSAFGANAPVDEAGFQLLQGEALLKAYESSPGKQRVFCSHCGSPLYSRSAAVPGVLRLRLGLLDTPPPLGPQAHIFAASKAPWYDILDGLPQFAQRPPQS